MLAIAFPLFLSPNPTERVDYRDSNDITIRDSFLLPRIDDILDTLGGSQIFSVIDLRAGYWQIPMSAIDKDKTSFSCHRGLFRFKRMPFGLRNAPAQFQRFMNRIFAPLIGKCVQVYLDDIVIFSKTAEDHEKHLDSVFKILEEHNKSDRGNNH